MAKKNKLARRKRNRGAIALHHEGATDGQMNVAATVTGLAGIFLALALGAVYLANTTPADLPSKKRVLYVVGGLGMLGGMGFAAWHVARGGGMPLMVGWGAVGGIGIGALLAALRANVSNAPALPLPAGWASYDASRQLA